MKRTYVPATLAALLALGALGGCADRRAEGPVFSTASHDDLVVTVRADRRTAAIGDTVALTIVAENPRFRDLLIESDTADPVLVTVWRYDAVAGWKRAMAFPPAPLRRYTAWVLEGRAGRTFTVELPIEPGWPVLETLKITAELAGRPDVRPHVFLTVVPR
ncbi:MAG: hypothetical protein GX591_00675 [Planctomycetes bacterium]|nr:hypothetical protein [Planctomycetota bacterium]